jgi:hypothetical protein
VGQNDRRTAPPVRIARGESGDGTAGAIHSRLEERRIFHAAGLQFHEATLSRSTPPPDPGRAHVYNAPELWPYYAFAHPVSAGHRLHYQRAPNLARITALTFRHEGANVLVHERPAQRLRYRIEIIRTKSAFRDALGTPGALVFYGGHARLGRGPCFGTDDDAPGDNWERGTDPNAYGLFRSGHRYVGVYLEDIANHGYHLSLATASEVNAAEISGPFADPLLRGNRLEPREVGSLRPASAPATWSLAERAGLAPTTQVWTYQGNYQNEDTGTTTVRTFVVVRAGWTDLERVDLRCRAYVSISCDSYTHNRPIWREPAFKHWQPHDDQALSYWMREVGGGQAITYFLYHLLTAPSSVASANMPWSDWLDYAATTTTRWMWADLERASILA